MAIDYEQVRRNNRQDPVGTLNPAEEAIIAKHRAELLERRKAEETAAEHAAYARFAAARAEQARDDRTAKVWAQASDNATRGLWTYDRVISSDPEICRFQAMRSELCIAGKTAKVL